MSWRELITGVIDNNVIIQQDYDLLQFIKKNNLKEAYGHHADYFDKFLNIVDHPTKFGICIVNYHYDFYNIVELVNQILQVKILPGGTLYLAMNKFLATPVALSEFQDLDYDQAIEQFFKKHIKGTVIEYSYKHNDDGSYFNFVHPLTRFYILNENN